MTISSVTDMAERATRQGCGDAPLVVLSRSEHMRLHGKDKKKPRTLKERERAVELRALGMTIQEADD